MKLQAAALIGFVILILSMTFGRLDTPSCVLKDINQFRNSIILVDGKDVEVKEARTSCEQEQGLQFVNEVPKSGMLFAFNSSEIRAFWMKNTLIPLSVAFIDESNRVSHILDMDVEPNPANPKRKYSSPTPFIMAIEVPIGQFDKLGVKVGSTIIKKGKTTP